MQGYVFKAIMVGSFLAIAVGLMSSANAADATYHVGYPGGKITKAQAIRELAISNNEKVVTKCQAVKLDEDKGTIKTR